MLAWNPQSFVSVTFLLFIHRLPRHHEIPHSYSLHFFSYFCFVYQTVFVVDIIFALCLYRGLNISLSLYIYIYTHINWNLYILNWFNCGNGWYLSCYLGSTGIIFRVHFRKQSVKRGGTTTDGSHRVQGRLRNAWCWDVQDLVVHLAVEWLALRLVFLQQGLADVNLHGYKVSESARSYQQLQSWCLWRSGNSMQGKPLAHSSV